MERLISLLILSKHDRVELVADESTQIRLLDVGAIAGTAYADYSWVDATCIDLNSQAPNVTQCDFFDYPVPPPDKLFDVVGLSLVINFVGSLTQRG